MNVLYLVGDCFVALFLVGWFMVWMMSPMMFAAPSASERVGAYLGALSFLYYPVYIGLLYWFFGGKLFSISGASLAKWTSIIVSIGCLPYWWSMVLLMLGVKRDD